MITGAADRTADRVGKLVFLDAATPVNGQSLVDVAVAAGLTKSRREARGMIEQGGLYLNNRRVDDPAAALSPADLLHGRYALLRRGAARQSLLRVSDGPPAG